MANCAGVQPGGPEALQCLQRNSAALSPACRTAVGAVSRGAPIAAAPSPTAAPPASEAAVPAAPAAKPMQGPGLIGAAMMLRACKIDLVRYCAGVQPGEGRELACLKSHQPLTMRCQMALGVISR
jgi:hypothetical protein